MLGIRFARRVSLKVKPDKTDEFLRRIKADVYPTLKREEGVRRVYLLRDTSNQNEFVSLTLWNSKRDADAYESSGHYSSNRDKVRELLEDEPAVSEFEVDYHAVGRAVPPPAAIRRGRVKGKGRRGKR